MPFYTYRAEWSPDYHAYVGRCLEMPRLFEVAASAPEAVARVEKLMGEWVTETVAAGREPPPSLTDKDYSGKFLVRVPLTLHARLAVEAAEEHVSLNQWVVHKLADRPIRPLFDDW